MQWNKFGNSFFKSDAPPEDVFDKLSPAVYSVKVTPQGIYYLERLFNKFDGPDKLYGDVESKTIRVIDSYRTRVTSTGVLFLGEKGSGKSLTAKHVCNKMLSDNIPVIVINAPHNSNGFSEFIKSIEQDCVIFIDEFEKLYKSEDENDGLSASVGDEVGGNSSASSQNKLLSLFDGVFSSKKLFILTANNKHQISSFLLNRPGRVYYLFEYNGLSQEFILEYCEDNLKAKEHIGKILAITSMFKSFTFDMLQGLVEEMNRFNLSPDDALDGLNIILPIFGAAKKRFRVTLHNKTNNTVTGLLFLDSYLCNSESNDNIIRIDVRSQDIIVYQSEESGVLCADTAPLYNGESVQNYDHEGFRIVTHFLTSDLELVDGKEGIYQYRNKDGFKLVLNEVEEYSHRMFDFQAV